MRRSKRQIEHIIRKKGAAHAPDPLSENPNEWPTPEGATIPVDTAIAAAKEIRSGTDGAEAWMIAAEKGLASDLPEVTTEGLDALEELGYPAEETERLKRSYGLLEDRDENGSEE